MKKHLIAAAVAAAVAAPAMAQNVELYGIFDVSYNNEKLKATDGPTGASRTAKASGVSQGQAAPTTVNAVDRWPTAASTGISNGALASSRIGLRGSEDLGGGLKATFNVEFGHNPGTASLGVANIRTSVVGLAGNFGTVNVGRQLTGIHGVVTATSPIAGSNMAGDVVYSAGLRIHETESRFYGGTLADMPGQGTRGNNMISYTTPAFSGVTARLDFGKDKVSADQTGGNVASDGKSDTTGLSLRYAAGPVVVTAGTHEVKSDVVPTYENDANAALDAKVSAERKFRVNVVAGSYDFGVAKVNLIYGENKTSQAARSGNGKADVLQVGISVPMGAWTLAAQYGEGTYKDSGTYGGAAATYSSTSDYDGYQLAAIYNLSKRTNVYVAYGTDEAKIKSSTVANEVGDKLERDQLAIGLRHSF